MLIINHGEGWISAMDNHQIQIGEDDQIMSAKPCSGKGVVAYGHIADESFVQGDPPEHPIAAAAPVTCVGIGFGTW